jgi:hypothetical protein
MGSEKKKKKRVERVIKKDGERYRCEGRRGHETLQMVVLSFHCTSLGTRFTSWKLGP